jgi:hypothetical protein
VKKSLPAGLHKIAIAPGGGAIIASDGLEVALLDAVSIRADEETVIRVVGPSLSFHEIQPQLGGLGDRRLGPLRVGTVSTVLVALALAALSFSFLGMLRRGAGAGAAAACALFAAAALASKLAMFAPITPGRRRRGRRGHRARRGHRGGSRRPRDVGGRCDRRRGAAPERQRRALRCAGARPGAGDDVGRRRRVRPGCRCGEVGRRPRCGAQEARQEGPQGPR